MTNKGPGSNLLYGFALAQKYLAMLALFIMCAINLVEIALRFLFDNSFIWIQDISVMLMLWMTFCGFSYVSYSKQDVLVDVFTNLLPLKGRQAVKLLTDLAIMVFLLIYLYFTVQLMISQFGQGTITTHLPLLYDSLPVGLNAFTLVLIYLNNVVVHGKELLSRQLSGEVSN